MISRAAVSDPRPVLTFVSGMWYNRIMSTRMFTMKRGGITYVVMTDHPCPVRGCGSELCVTSVTTQQGTGDVLYHLECRRNFRHSYHLIGSAPDHLIRVEVGRWGTQKLPKRSAARI